MTYHFKLGEDGRTVVLPAEMVSSLGLQPGSDLAADVEGMTFRVSPEAGESDHAVHQPVSAALARLQAGFEGYTLDEFLADRRNGVG